MAIIDPRCSAWVTATDGLTVKVERVGYMNGAQTKDKLGIYVFANFRKRAAWCIPYKLLLPGSVDDFATLPDFAIDMAGGGFIPSRGEVGPFTIQMGDAKVSGMGLPVNEHVIYCVTFSIPREMLL